jgi:hypothetical protein
MGTTRTPVTIRRSLRSESGSILILTALSTVVLLGIAALAVDGSYMYTERNRMWAAADAAAKSAALEVFYGNDAPASLNTFADHEVQLHNFAPLRLSGDTEVLVYNPPITGDHIGDDGYVEVTVARTTATFFGTILGWANMRPLARAVAGQSSGPNCLIALGPPGSSPDSISIGVTHLNMPNCNIADAGDLRCSNPGGQCFIDSRTTAIGSTACEGRCDNMGDIIANAPAPSDPLAGRLADVSHGACVAPPATGIIPANTCYSGLHVGVDREFASGTVYFNGPITFDSGRQLTGNGTTLVLDVGASLVANQNNTVTLVAPTAASGATYPGIALYQVAANTSDITFENSSSLNITGAMYAPTADVYFRNGLDSSSDCVLFVVQSITIENGDGALNNACAAYGGSPLMTVTLAE